MKSSAYHPLLKNSALMKTLVCHPPMGGGHADSWEMELLYHEDIAST